MKISTLFRRVMLLAAAISTLAAINGCNGTGKNANSSTDSQTVAMQAPPSCGNFTMDPCNFQGTPPCCTSIADCNVIPPACINALRQQHWIDTTLTVLFESFKIRISGQEVDVPDAKVRQSIQANSCNDLFLMRMFDSTNGRRYVTLNVLHLPKTVVIERTFPVSLINYILLPASGPSIEGFVFSKLATPAGCPGYESILMKVVRAGKTDYYDVSVPPDWTKDSVLRGAVSELINKSGTSLRQVLTASVPIPGAGAQRVR